MRVGAAGDGAAGMVPLDRSPAAGTYTDAEPVNTVGFSCSSIAAGAATLVPDTVIGLGIQGTAPRVGDVFYLRIAVAVLDDPCSGGTTVLPEVLPPKGVATAIDAAHPVLLRYEEYDGANADDAAVKVKPGQTGGTELDAISTRAPRRRAVPARAGRARSSRSTCRCALRAARPPPTSSTSSTTSATADPEPAHRVDRAAVVRPGQAGGQGRQEGGADRHHRARREGHRDAHGGQEEGRQRQGDRERGRHRHAQAEGQGAASSAPS